LPEVVIAAIARIGDKAEIEKLLAGFDGLDAGCMTLFAKNDPPEVPARLRMHFIPFQGSPVASSSHGTNVPGMGATLALNPYVDDAAGMDHLKGTTISPDAAHYYNMAIDKGLSVVTYVTSRANAALVESQFRVCGFVKIRRFPCAKVLREASL